MVFKSGVVFVMSCSKDGVKEVLPPAGFYPDSQNRCFDGAKIKRIFEISKYFNQKIFNVLYFHLRAESTSKCKLCANL